MFSGTVQSAPAGVKGFDADTPISSSAAREFFARGYRFCLRYVGLLQMGPGDLTAAEGRDLLSAGLALMVVQHVDYPGWMPSAALGPTNGKNAAAFSKAIGVPGGVSVWLGLEGIAAGASGEDVTAYWAGTARVAAAGYVPGVYVGWRPGLSGQQLYELPFQHYWGAYNVDGNHPQLRLVPQAVARVLRDRRRNRTGVYDDDVTQTDGEGRQAQWPCAGAERAS